MTRDVTTDSNCAFVLLVLLAACGSDSHRIQGGDTDPTSSDGQSSSSGDPERDIRQGAVPCEGPCNDTGPRAEPLARPRCPETEPAVGDGCNDDDGGLVCSYGDSPTPWCRTFYECNATWKVPSDKLRWPCREALDCPNVAPEHLSECTVGLAGSGVPCTYDDQDLSCYCSNGIGTEGLPGVWVCLGPPRSLDCPASMPNIGEGCDVMGTECNYYQNGCQAPPHASVFCFDGVWEEGDPPFCADG